MPDTVLGGVRIEIRGDWSMLSSDFAKAESAAKSAAGTISGNLNASLGTSNGLVDQFGRSIQSAGTAATTTAGQTDKLAASIRGLSGNIATSATTTRILTDALQNTTAASNAGAAAMNSAAAGIAQVGGQIGAAVDKMAAASTAANSLRGAYLSLGLAVRSIRIAELLYRGGEAIYDLYTSTRDAVSKIEAIFGDLNRSISTTTEELALASARVDNTLAKLSGKPENTVATALHEGAVEAYKFADATDKVLDKLHQLFKETEVGGFKGAFTGQVPTDVAFLGPKLTQQFDPQGKLGQIPQALRRIGDDAAEAMRHANTEAERLAVTTDRDRRMTNVYEEAIKQLRAQLAYFEAPHPNLFGLPGSTADASAGIQQVTEAIRTLKAQMEQIPIASAIGPKQRTAEQIERDRENARRAAIEPLASNQAQLEGIKSVSQAKSEAAAQAIALAKAQRDAEIEAIAEPAARALAAAQAELKARQENLAAVRAQASATVPREVSAVQERGRLEARGQAPEEARAAGIKAQAQAQEVLRKSTEDQAKAENEVAIAAAKVTGIINEQARAAQEAAAAMSARIAASDQAAAAERQILEQERAQGTASKASGDVRISQMREQAALQSTQRQGEISQIQARLSTETEEAKVYELIAEISAKRTQAANQAYAAETKILAAIQEERLQLSEVESKREGAVSDALAAQQKVALTGAARQAGPGITPEVTLRNEAALKQQILAIDIAQHAQDVQRLQTQGDIQSLYGDQIAAAQSYAQADKEDLDYKTQQMQAQEQINELLQQASFQYQLQSDLRQGLQSAEAGLGQGIAAGVFGNKRQGEDIGTQVTEALRRAGQQVLGNVLTTVIRQLITTIVTQTGAQSAFNAIFGTATAANTAAVTANTAAVAANTAASSQSSAASALGPIGAVAGFAGGGRPDPGKVAWVGERGPELFIPDSAGTIVPGDKIASQGLPGLPSISGVSNTATTSIGAMHFHVMGQVSPREFVRQVAQELPRLLKAQGGPLFGPNTRSGQNPASSG